MSESMYECAIEAKIHLGCDSVKDVLWFLSLSGTATLFEHLLGPLINTNNPPEVTDLHDLKFLIQTAVNNDPDSINSEEFENALTSMDNEQLSLASLSVFTFIAARVPKEEADMNVIFYVAYMLLKLTDAISRYRAEEGDEATQEAIESLVVLDENESSDED